MISIIKALLKKVEKQQLLNALEKTSESARNKEMFRRALNHQTYEAVGEEFGISKDRVRTVISRIERKCREIMFPLNEVEALQFSGRLRNALRSEQITTKEQLRRALEDGSCWRWPNYGEKCHVEACKAVF
jgi:DNA-binding CsgD family transcriptional regulator